jgi:parallel beta-helix repeat protein
VAIVVGLALASAQPAAAATTIRVPQDQPTIQAGIDTASPGDTVLVAAGLYVENIDFRGKEITVKSESGRNVTIIDGGHVGPVVRINASSGQRPVLRGFTIRNGANEGGVVTSGGPAVIEKNKITGNATCGEGGGVDASFSSAVIRQNMITNNRQQACSGGPGGGGIAIRGAGTVQVIDNRITGNSHGSFGGGISLFAAGAPTISGNRIQNNSAGNEGGGIWIVNQSDATIVNNIITGNTSGAGGGIYWLVPSGAIGPAVVNNTIASNGATNGSAVFADGFDAQARLVNNILVGSGTAAVLYCGNFNDPFPPQISFNDVWNTTGGPRYGGICSDRTGTAGNISADPVFDKKFHLQQSSPAVDAGTNADAPARDIDHQPRPLDGDGDGSAIVDMGADEVLPPA